MEMKRLGLVLADISGYTKFLKMHTMSLLHAEMIITELLEAVIDHAEHPLILSKLEGDAAFLYAELGEDEQAAARDILRQVVGFFEAFIAKERELIACDSCGCDACRNIEQLNLKAILHCGEVAIKQIREFTELAGEAVIVAHRLLKNSIPAKEYILMTETFFELSGGFANGEVETCTEEVEGIGSMQVRVYYPALDKQFPTQPIVNFPAPGSEFRRLADRWNDHARRRIQGKEPPANFSSLPQKEMTWWNRFDYFVLSDMQSALRIKWRNLMKRE